MSLKVFIVLIFIVSATALVTRCEVGADMVEDYDVDSSLSLQVRAKSEKVGLSSRQ
ncbi:hypothetical protein Bhyg_08862 [Pseudolycoriella hygida]|uniref:Uncharacterized protein n=1 Tax=Pseudolycoriella hygida TaxID=35572 RepID=A0A9Q0N5E9_9DIPT|nr:hypothetical protein Bhyg_08862 [Pseudolycoriella hygida]